MPVANLTKKIKYFVTNFSANTVSVIDGVNNTIVKTYSVAEQPRGCSSDGDGNIYIASVEGKCVTIICSDGSTKIINNIPNDGFIAVDKMLSRFYVTNSMDFDVYDISSGIRILSIPGLIAPIYLTMNKSKSKVFIVDSNNVMIFSTSTLELLDTIKLPSKANYIVVSNDDTKLFISYGYTSIQAGVAVYDLVNNSIITNIIDKRLSDPQGMTILNNILFVANNVTSGTLIPFDTLTYTILENAIIKVGINPIRVIGSPDNRKLYVVNKSSGTISIIDLAVNSQYVANVIPLKAGIFDIIETYMELSTQRKEALGVQDTYKTDDIKQSVSIIAKKVFSHCQQRIGFPMIKIPLVERSENVSFESIRFYNGSRVPGTTIITSLPERPNYSRVQIKVSVPYKATLRNLKGEEITVTGVLPDIDKDIVMYIPQTRDEFVFDIVIETRTEQLNEATVHADYVLIAVGVFLVIKIVGEVEITLPVMGIFPEPPECEEYEAPREEDVCKTFLDFSRTPFPNDFFPTSF